MLYYNSFQLTVFDTAYLNTNLLGNFEARMQKSHLMTQSTKTTKHIKLIIQNTSTRSMNPGICIKVESIFIRSKCLK